MKTCIFALLLAFTGCTYNVSQQQISGPHHRAAQAVGITNDGVSATQYSEGAPVYRRQASAWDGLGEALQGVIQINVNNGYGGNGYGENGYNGSGYREGYRPEGGFQQWPPPNYNDYFIGKTTSRHAHGKHH